VHYFNCKANEIAEQNYCTMLHSCILNFDKFLSLALKFVLRKFSNSQMGSIVSKVDDNITVKKKAKK
jgi:hypothetical protein